MAKLSPIYNDAQLINGIPAVGAQVFTYAAGSSTKLTTYTDEAGTVPQSNPILLNARGEPTNGPIWLTEGQSYKFVFTSSTDTDPPTSPIRTVDNVIGVGDASLTLDQWVDSGVTPTYVSATQFTLPGDQTSAFQVNRRIKATVTAGTVFGYISASVYGALTTVTVVLDSGALDSGLSSVQLGLITPTDTSLFQIQTSNLADGVFNGLSAVTFDNAVDYVAIADGNDSGNKKKALLPKGSIQDIDASVAGNALTITVNQTTLQFRSTTLTDGTPETVNLASAVTVVVPNTATLGTVNATAARLAVLAINNAGSIEAAVVNLAGGNQLDETNLISTTAVSTGADSANVIYSTTARTNVAYRVVGFIDITEATAGTWATAPTLVQGAGGNAMTALSSLGYGQAWQEVTRTSGVTYYNTTGKPIALFNRASSTAALCTQTISINGATAITFNTVGASTAGNSSTVIIPPGASYVITDSNVGSKNTYELR